MKNGHRQGKQSYLCRECGRQFRDSPCPAGYSSDVKELCVKMSLNGMGFRAIERVTGISHNTVLNWVRLAHSTERVMITMKFLRLLKLMNCKLLSAQKKTKFGFGQLSIAKGQEF